MAEYVEVCEAAARRGAAVLVRWADRFTVREKAPADLVTEADVAAQEAIAETLMAAFPEHGLLAEEADAPVRPDAPSRWIVDPLDGTTNYVHQCPGYSVSVALEEQGRLLVGTVYDPIADECFVAEAGRGAFLNGRRLSVSGVRELSQALVAASFPARLERGAREIGDFVDVLLAAQSVRRAGSAALNFCFLAAGRYDGYWSTSTKPWDIAAGMLIAREAGGVVTAPDGGEVNLAVAHFVAAATQALHRQLLELVGTKA